MSDVLLVAHGSRDPRARTTVQHLAAAVRRRLPGRVVATCALDLEAPSPRTALVELARRGSPGVRVVPLLFAPGYHVRVDLPREIAEAAAASGRPAGDPACLATLAPPLIDVSDAQSSELLLDALDARAGPPIRRADALVLLAAGSSDDGARAAVASLARSWGDRHGVPASAAFATGPGPDPASAVVVARAGGAARVLAGSLFLAPGLLPDRAQAAAAVAGAKVAPVLGAVPALAELVARRAEPRARPHPRDDQGTSAPRAAEPLPAFDVMGRSSLIIAGG